MAGVVITTRTTKIFRFFDFKPNNSFRMRPITCTIRKVILSTITVIIPGIIMIKYASDNFPDVANDWFIILCLVCFSGKRIRCRNYIIFCPRWIMFREKIKWVSFICKINTRKIVFLILILIFTYVRVPATDRQIRM